MPSSCRWCSSDGLAACSDDDADGGDADLVVYTGRAEEQVGDLIAQFEEESGTTVDVRYGDTAELAVQLLEEGDASPGRPLLVPGRRCPERGRRGGAAQRPVARGAQAGARRSTAPPTVGGSAHPVGPASSPTTPTRSTPPSCPKSVFELTDPEWADRVAIAPTNGSFQAFVTAMRESEGDDVAEQWLLDLKANGAVAYESNTPILDAVDAGEIDLGLINHYYWFQKAAEVGEDEITAQIDFFEPGDPGSLVNVSGAGVLTTAEDAALAESFIDYLLEESGQTYLVDVTKEYPLIDGVDPQPGLPPLDELRGPDVGLSELADLEGTLEMLTETGWI